MQLTLGRKLFLYTSVLLLGALLIAFAVLERDQARQWQDYLQVQQVAFARFATPELLKHFRGNFAQAGPAHREQLKGLLGFNPDLVKITIYSPTGRTLFDPPPLLNHDALPIDSVDLSWTQSALDPVSRALDLPKGERLLEVVAPAFGPTGAKVLQVRYLFSFRSMEKRLAQMHRAFLTIALVTSGSALLLVALVARRFTQPIHRLIAGVRAISRGELQTNIPTKGSDELTALGTAFNEMAGSLNLNQNELQAKNLQLREANEELRQIHERLIRTERLAAVGQVAAGVSHEIDNPVGIILGYAELLLEDLDKDDLRAEDLKAIIAECHRCKKITGGLLGLARIGAQQWEPIDLLKLTQETIASLGPQKLFREIRVHAPETPVLPGILGDADRIRQILVNLLLNAAQALSGKGEIWVCLSAKDDYLHLEVHDDGSGIDPGKLEQIFEPFFSTKGRSVGTGLGLSVCRKLIEEHGGTISASKSPYGGALLKVALPLAASSHKV